MSNQQKSVNPTKLREFLQNEGLSQSDAIRLYFNVTGEQIGKDRMSHYVNGKREPQTAVALNLAKALNTTVEEIFGDIIQ
jgi:transcriptional regulator with XRE-family HTH domain